MKILLAEERPVARLRARLAGFPFGIFALALALGIVGIVFLHSTTLGSDDYLGQDRNQAPMMLVMPLLAAMIAFLPRPKVLEGAAWLYAGTVLVLLLMPFFGVTINGARRWIRVAGVSFQPAELLKPALVLVLARFLRFRTNAGFAEGIGMPFVMTLIPIALLVRQPDLGTALSLLPVLFAMCYAAGARGRTLVLLGCGGLLSAAVLVPFLHSYQQERIAVWLTQAHLDAASERGPGYHLVQSLISVGSGGWVGDGLFKGEQNLNDFLPYRSTDFLFAVVAEETGFVGASALVIGYLGMCLLILRQAARIRDRFGRLLATGMGVMLATQLFIHVGVCIGLLPTTGLPLPLLSYGRSSVMAAWLSLGLVAHAIVRRPRTVARDMYL